MRKPFNETGYHYTMTYDTVYSLFTCMDNKDINDAYLEIRIKYEGNFDKRYELNSLYRILNADLSMLGSKPEYWLNLHRDEIIQIISLYMLQKYAEYATNYGEYVLTFDEKDYVKFINFEKHNNYRAGLGYYYPIYSHKTEPVEDYGCDENDVYPELNVFDLDIVLIHIDNGDFSKNAFFICRKDEDDDTVIANYFDFVQRNCRELEIAAMVVAPGSNITIKRGRKR